MAVLPLAAIIAMGPAGQQVVPAPPIQPQNTAIQPVGSHAELERLAAQRGQLHEQPRPAIAKQDRLNTQERELLEQDGKPFVIRGYSCDAARVLEERLIRSGGSTVLIQPARIAQPATASAHSHGLAAWPRAFVAPAPAPPAPAFGQGPLMPGPNFDNYPAKEVNPGVPDSGGGRIRVWGYIGGSGAAPDGIVCAGPRLWYADQRDPAVPPMVIQSPHAGASQPDREPGLGGTRRGR